jgi:hypothetical protein
MAARVRKEFLDGLLTATVAVAEITGKLPLDEMPDQTWKLICSINKRLLELSLIEANGHGG